MKNRKLWVYLGVVILMMLVIFTADHLTDVTFTSIVTKWIYHSTFIILGSVVTQIIRLAG